MREVICQNIAESIEAKQRLFQDSQCIDTIETVANMVVEAYRQGHKILTCGNGGSACDAQHFVGELVGRYKKERQGIAAISLCGNVANLTAIGNDYDYDRIFSNQVIALGQPGDVLFAISTSGNSKNCVKAVEEAKKRGILTVGLTGEKGGALKDLCDATIAVPSSNTPRIQEMHILTIHSICHVVEDTLYAEGILKKWEDA
ncbi:MAG: D-sedoheptulose 7-phosphate isomerase [Lachnospiraceae bacterium]|nr:D-sedoheptulose 7-phosphate isomerase [Lachnospiraceae bacterium]